MHLLLQIVHKMYKDIFVPINKINKAEDGDKVLVNFRRLARKRRFSLWKSD